MIEGLRLLPWFQEAARRDVLGPQAKCETCMQARDQQTRQLWGCGYEPPPPERLAPHVRLTLGTLGYSGPTPTVCPGYSTRLPEVIQVARARMHWTKGGPSSIGIEDWRTSSTAIGIEILEQSVNECSNWTTTPRSKGGGRDES